MSRKNFDKFTTPLCQGFRQGVNWEWGSGWVFEVLLIFNLGNRVSLPIASLNMSLFTSLSFLLSFFAIYAFNASLWSSDL